MRHLLAVLGACKAREQQGWTDGRPASGPPLSGSGLPGLQLFPLALLLPQLQLHGTSSLPSLPAAPSCRGGSVRVELCVPAPRIPASERFLRGLSLSSGGQGPLRPLWPSAEQLMSLPHGTPSDFTSNICLIHGCTRRACPGCALHKYLVTKSMSFGVGISI